MQLIGQFALIYGKWGERTGYRSSWSIKRNTVSVQPEMEIVDSRFAGRRHFSASQLEVKKVTDNAASFDLLRALHQVLI